MKEKFSTSVHRVRDRRSAAALTKPFQRHLVLALIKRKATISELVAESGCPMSLIHYNVRRLVELGLLRIASEVKRAGRPMRRYTAVGDAFYVPTELMAEHPGTRLQRELSAVLEAGGHSTRGIFFGRDSAGAAVMRPVAGDGANSLIVLDGWHLIELGKQEAIRLAGEIATIVKRAEARSKNRGGGTYLVRTAIVRRIQASISMP